MRSVQIVHLAPCEVAKRPVLMESVHADIAASVWVVSPNKFVLLAVNDERIFAAHPVCIFNVEFVHMGNTTQAVWVSKVFFGGVLTG